MIFKGLTLHKRQKEIANDIISSNAKYFIINASRQSGKSVSMSQLLLYFGINNPNKEISYITPTYKLAKKFFKNIFNAIKDSGVILKHNKSDLLIDLINGTEIVFSSAEAHESIRGNTYDYVFLDEFAFFKSDAWESIKPTVAAKKKAKMIISSTPKGRNLFYDLAMLGQSSNDRYKYYYMHYSDNPMYDIDEVLDAKKVMPENAYKQEYEAEFIDDGGQVFKNVKINQTITQWSEPIFNERYSSGIDWGKENDSTVVHTLDSKGNTVHILSIKNQSYNVIIDEVTKVLTKYNSLAYVETNGIGNPLFDALQLKYRNLVAWINTNKEKTDAVESLILGFVNNEIKIPTSDLHKDLDFQLSVFSFEYNLKSRTIKYAAMTPHHDDEVIALMLAYKSMKDNKFVGNYITHQHENKFGY